VPCPRCQSMVHVIAPGDEGPVADDAGQCLDGEPPAGNDPLVPPGGHRRIAITVAVGVLMCGTVAGTLAVWIGPRAPTPQPTLATPTAANQGTNSGRKESSSADQSNAPPYADGPPSAHVAAAPEAGHPSAPDADGATEAVRPARDIDADAADRTTPEPDVAAISSHRQAASDSVDSAGARGEHEEHEQHNEPRNVAQVRPAEPASEPPRSIPAADHRPQGVPAIRKVDTPSEPARTASLKTRLGLRLNSISVHESPLAGYLAFLSELSAVPITLDVDALASRKLTPMVPVSLSAQDAMIADALRRVIAPLGLVATIEDNRHVVITTREAPHVVQRVYEIDDLQRNGAKLRDVATTSPLAECLRAVIAPGSWTASGGRGNIVEGPGRLTVTQSHAVHGQIEAFLARLRQARGYPGGQTSGAPEAGSAAIAGDRTVSVTFVEPVRLARLMRQLEIAGGIQFVVDWRSLESLGLTPDTQVTCSVTDVPVDVALSSLLKPLGADWRLLDDSVVHVSTSAPTFVHNPVLLPVAKHIEAGWTPTDLMNMLDDAASKNPQVTSASWEAIRYDAPSRHVVLAGPPDRRRNIERILKQSPRPLKQSD